MLAQNDRCREQSTHKVPRPAHDKIVTAKGELMLRIPSLARRPLFAAVAFVGIGVLFVTFGSFRANSTHNSQPVEVELITLRPAGFEPSEISRPKGAFVLFIDDRTGKQNSSLELHRVTGERLRAISLNRRRSEWHDVVDLTPGTYVLQDAGNAEARCQITILP